MVDRLEKIWMDGELVAWDDAKVHVLTHTLHYGLGGFEGIRAYKRGDGKSAVFRLREHIDRLFDTTKLCLMPMPFTREQVMQGCIDVLKANKLPEGYLRPIAYVGEGAMGIYVNNPTKVSIVAWKWGAYLGDEALAQGIRAKISSFARHHINIGLNKAKELAFFAERPAAVAGG